MKTQRNIVQATLLVMLITCLAGSLAAQQPTRMAPARMNQELAQPITPAAPMPPPPSSMDRPDRGMPPQIDIPGLTEEQRDKIRHADIEHMKTMTPLRNQMGEKRARLHTLLTTLPFDAKAADQVADDLGKTETAILKEQIRHDQELKGLLNPQQQVMFDTRPKPFLRRK